jgi:hypothetical protein
MRRRESNPYDSGRERGRFGVGGVTGERKVRRLLVDR